MTWTPASLFAALSLSIALAPLPVVAAVQDVATMSDEDRMERAKQLYGEGDAAFNEGDAATALAKFEEAYNTYAPSLHVFNINIGLAAYDLGDCAKAKVAFQRFLDLVPEHPARAQAQEKMLEIERSGCDQAAPAPAEPAPVVAPVITTTPPVEDNDDAPELTSRRSEREEQADRERQENAGAGPKLIAGAVLTAVGGLGLIGGMTSAIIANQRAKELAALSRPGVTGFPAGDYSNDDVANLDRAGLPAANTASVAMFIGGGVLAAIGITLIVLDRTGKKKSRDKNARTSGPRLTGVGPAVLRGGGAAAATLRF